jgi:hypothetical protein
MAWHAKEDVLRTRLSASPGDQRPAFDNHAMRHQTEVSERARVVEGLLCKKRIGNREREYGNCRSKRISTITSVHGERLSPTGIGVTVIVAGHKGHIRAFVQARHVPTRDKSDPEWP